MFGVGDVLRDGKVVVVVKDYKLCSCNKGL